MSCTQLRPQLIPGTNKHGKFVPFFQAKISRLVDDTLTSLKAETGWEVTSSKVVVSAKLETTCKFILNESLQQPVCSSRESSEEPDARGGSASPVEISSGESETSEGKMSSSTSTQRNVRSEDKQGRKPIVKYGNSSGSRTTQPRYVLLDFIVLGGLVGYVGTNYHQIPVNKRVVAVETTDHEPVTLRRQKQLSRLK